jgi:hypothetical protein
LSAARDGNGQGFEDARPFAPAAIAAAHRRDVPPLVFEYAGVTTAERARALSRAHFAQRLPAQPNGQPSGQMVEVKADELDGAALAWAVAIAEGREPILQAPCYGLPWRVAVMEAGRLIAWRPERDWSQTGPLLDQWVKSFGMVQDGRRETFRAFAYDHDHYYQRIGSGPSVQVAACRARVKVVIGDTVSIPAELAVYLGA